jgi:deoxyribonuclease-4
VHAGSAVLADRLDDALRRLPDHLLPVLDTAPGPPLLIEPTAGGGAALAAGPTSLAAYLDTVGRDERVGVCLDTCHVHAAGHDLSTAPGFAAALRVYTRAVGRGRIGLIHVNDSRDPAGSRRDRHETIGAGTIGRESFAALFASPVIRGVPLVVETADTSHRADIATLVALRAAAVAAA